MAQKQWSGRARLVTPVPLVELADDKRVLIEHHGGVSSYTCEEVMVRVRFGFIRVLGTGLRIARMSRDQLVICGSIQGVSLVKLGVSHGK